MELGCCKISSRELTELWSEWINGLSTSLGSVGHRELFLRLPPSDACRPTVNSQEFAGRAPSSLSPPIISSLPSSKRKRTVTVCASSRFCGWVCRDWWDLAQYSLPTSTIVIETNNRMRHANSLCALKAEKTSVPSILCASRAANECICRSTGNGLTRSLRKSGELIVRFLSIVIH